MRKIALIEDDSDLYALLKYNLEKRGLCRRERHDLILLDIMLPDSDGLDICKGIRNQPELAHIASSSLPPEHPRWTASSDWNSGRMTIS